MAIVATGIAELIAFIYLALIISVGFFSYRVGKNKTGMPKTCAFLGVCFSLVPPLGLMFIAALLLKREHQGIV